METNGKMNNSPSAKSRGRRLLFDLLLIGGAVTVGLVAMLIVFLTRREGGYAVVEIDGSVVSEYPLSNDGEYSLNGGTNILVIENGKAYVREASCPDGTCIRRGEISYEGEDIICLPNKVRVYIRGIGDEIL